MTTKPKKPKKLVACGWALNKKQWEKVKKSKEYKIVLILEFYEQKRRAH